MTAVPMRARLAPSLVPAALLVLAGLTYSSWVLEFVLDTGLNPINSFLSELDAEGRRYREVFSIADTITGAFVLVAALLGLWLFPRRKLVVTGWIALAVFGASTIADARFPLETGPAEPSGLFPQLHHIHALTSTLAVFGIFIAMIAFTLASHRYGILPVLRHAGLWVLIGVSLATAWMLIGDNLPGDTGLGIAQRIQVGLMSAWLIILGVVVRCWRA